MSELKQTKVSSGMEPRNKQEVQNEPVTGAPDDLYQDATQESVRKLQEQAKDAARYEDETDARDVIKGVFGFIATVVLAFGWMMLMLLIISFIGLGYLHFEIKVMVLVSVVFAVGAGVFYIHGRIRGARMRRIRKRGKK
jgi:cation transport ATPase